MKWACFVRRAAATAAAGLLAALPVQAELSVASVFGSSMVLQRDMAAPVWGKADPNQQVTVQIDGQTHEVQADRDGKWRTHLDPMAAGGPFTMTVEAGDETLTLEDVLVGEVWVCSGQSNMEWPVQASLNAEQEIASANYPLMRLYTVEKKTAQEPQETCNGVWQVCTPETIPAFSAVAYYFGRPLHKELDIPIGLIHTSWGGTPAEAWTTQETIDADYPAIVERWEHAIRVYPEALAEYEKQMEERQKAVEKARAEGTPEPPFIWPPQGPESPGRPASLYNAMIHPIAPYAIRGAIWYQGESNAGRAYQYRRLFPAMIKDWRQAWGQGDFPFLFVQLANFTARSAEPKATDAWAELREAQTMTLSLPATGMAVTIDIGDANDIHPKNKQDVGMRLALIALAKTYGQNISYSGPMYSGMEVKGAEVVLHFDHTDGGLMAKDGPLAGFQVAGEDQQFVWADARIEGDTVVVSAEGVEAPASVRYAWQANPGMQVADIVRDGGSYAWLVYPACNLYNGAGLPASPFRTDDWPGETIDQE